MPHPIVYNGGQDDDQTRAIDVVHIEPSIREGVHLVSSLYGTEASAPIYRYPPVNTFPPYLTGETVIPNLLTCNTGQWDSSPSALFAFQWMSDGIDIAGATEQTWMSTPEFEDTEITCEVRAFNPFGEVYIMSSNSLFISLIEPIEVRDLDSHWLTGLQAESVQTMFNERNMVTSGTAAPGRMDMMRATAYFSTGTAAPTRFDLNAMNICSVSGISRAECVDVSTEQVFVVNYYEGQPLVESIGQVMPLKNPQAEDGIFGWTMFGKVQITNYESSAIFFPDRQQGSFAWFGGIDIDAAQDNIPYSYIFQDVEVLPIWQSDVDLDDTGLNVEWFQFKDKSGNDQANVRFEFYNGTNDLIGFDLGEGFISTPVGIWLRRSYTTRIPPLTRYVRIFVEFNLQDGTDNDTAVDSVILSIFKGDSLTNRVDGPSFNMWRLYFNQANTYSGGGLSELEFRTIPGGADLVDSAVGGSAISGSNGQGVTNAVQAFDNLRNIGFWAGADNAISQGRSWVGYNFNAAVRPQSIDITAMQSSAALWVPRSYYIEGSNDGEKWTRVHWVDAEMAGGDYSSEERREILLPTGSFPYFRDHPDWLSADVAYGPYRAEDGVFLEDDDDFAGKGNVYHAHSRINMTEISAYIAADAVGFDYTMTVARVTKLNGIFRVNEILEQRTFTSNPGDTPGWVNIPTEAVHEFDVGEDFLIYFHDNDAANNPDTPGEGRLGVVKDFGLNDPNLKLMRRVADYVFSWARTGQFLQIGSSNQRFVSTDDIFWALDFKGDLF